MCGICGFVGQSLSTGDPAPVRRMADALAHRGPDAEGVAELTSAAFDHTVGWFGHRRLRILDLSPAAAQPMVGRDGGTTLSFNGEVYNFRSLRRDLESRGHRFASSGDTEVVLRAFEQWGSDFVRRLDGMFALALWDAQNAKLILARDRTGKKPLFYARGAGFAFASEIKALAHAPGVTLAPALSQLPAFLTYGYVPWPETFYEGVLQVPPASVVRYTPSDGTVEVCEYWAPPSPGDQPPVSAAELREALVGATERRMVSDVPLGALLSGGIDSSVIVSLMARASSEPVRTFSISFPDQPTFDETPWAELVAKRLGTTHQTFAVDVDAVALLDQLVWLHDGPFGDSSAIPTYLVCAAAANEVRVVLTGDGGDETFAGYERFAAAALAQAVPAPAARAAAAAAGRLPSTRGYNSLRKRLLRFGEDAHKPIAERYLGWLAIFDQDSLRELGSGPADVDVPFRRAMEEPATGSALDRIVHANLRTYLPDDLLVKVDRMSMGHSLEVRSPFLDTALLDLLGGVSASKKIGYRRIKPLLRTACGPLIPPEIWRRRKHGFGVPVGAWYRGELGELFEDEVIGAGSHSADLLADGAAARLLREHRSGSQDHGARLWSLTVLERWLRSCERSPLANPPEPGWSGIQA